MFLRGQLELKKWIDKEFVRARKDGEIVNAEVKLMAELSPMGFFRKL